MKQQSREQQLIDIMFQIGFTSRENEVLLKMSRDEYGAWIAEQLRICGFDTEPRGASWGVLK